MLHRIIQCWFATALLCALASGCRGPHPHDCSGIRTLPPVDPNTVLKIGGTHGVSVNFDGLDSPLGLDPLDFFQGESVTVSLQDTFCLASRNSRLANLIDRERKAVCCQSGCIQCVERFLSGQAEEQRIKSAADAAELLIRLAGTELQSEIIGQSLTKIAELRETVDAADENGMATAEPSAELDKQLIEIKRKQVEIDSGVFELNAKLNLLLGIDSCDPRRIQPEYHFETDLGEMDVEQLIIDALSSRPELKSLSGFGACSGDEQCLAILSNLDRRLGLAASKPVTRLLFRAKKDEQNKKCCCHIRQQQLDELRSLQEELIRQQVLERYKEVRFGYESLKLEDEDLRRLHAQAEQIESAAVLDAQESFVNAIANFAEQQMTNSRRVSAMVEFEVAKIRLREATGSLTAGCCALTGTASCSCRIE